MGQIIHREYIVFRGSNISCCLTCRLSNRISVGGAVFLLVTRKLSEVTSMRAVYRIITRSTRSSCADNPTDSPSIKHCACFMKAGLKRDPAKLLTGGIEADSEVMGDYNLGVGQ